MTDTSAEELIKLEEEPPPSDSSWSPRRRWIVIAILGAVLVAVGATAGPLAWQVMTQKGAKLSMPATVGTLTRDDTDGAKETASDLVTALRAEIELDSSAGAIYTDPAASTPAAKSIMLFGGTTLLWSPGKELDTVLTLLEDTGDSIKDLSEVDAGPLGGIMKCGATGSPGADGSPMAVCGWADHGSIALALFPGRAPADSAVLMRQLRAATLTR